MAIKPILFNTEMVRAILDGRKSCTRRLVKIQPKDNEYTVVFTRKDVQIKTEKTTAKSPYQVGDILYVRETWHKYIKRVGKGESCHLEEFYGYKASVTNWEDANEPWRPSIHMPKEAARIWLKVTDVRVERLQSITVEGAIREGAEGEKCHHTNAGAFGCTDCMNTGWIEPPQVEFMQIWNSTIKKPDLKRYGWDANPWVWVIEFERCEKPEGV